MHFRFEATARIAAARLVAVIRSDSERKALEAARAALAGGITVLEIAFTTPGAQAALRQLADETAGLRDTPLLGAGTVLDAETAVAALRAGARFLVSPGLVPEVIRAASRYGAPAVPGAGTVTEILGALECGADLVKIFPAEIIGLAFVRAVRPVLPRAGLVPTGGVTADNARDWLEAGAVAVGVGGWLTKGEPAEIENRARELVRAVGAR